MIPLIVIGGGGHARVVIDIVSDDDDFLISGYVDRADRGTVLGVPYLGTDENVLADFVAQHGGAAAAVGIGIIGRDGPRPGLLRKLLALGYRLPPLVSKYARIRRETRIGAGTVVCHSAVLQACAAVGVGSILNTSSVVEHDCRVGDGVHVAPGAILCGGVDVGDGCLIGAGAVVVPGCRIAAGCIVGAGSVVTENINEAGVYVGAPARRR